MTTHWYTGYDGIEYPIEMEDKQPMKTLEPIITTHQDMIACHDTIGRDKPLDAIVWVADANRHTPSGVLIETVFFMAYNSQGFMGMLDKSPDAPAHWFPWGNEYRFYIHVNE